MPSSGYTTRNRNLQAPSSSASPGARVRDPRNASSVCPLARVRNSRRSIAGLFSITVLIVPTEAGAAVDAELQYVLNSLSFLFWGVLVMWMCAGFTMLEAGSVQTKNTSVVCLKNLGVCSIAGLTFYLVGYNIMYVGVEPGGWFGSLQFLHDGSDAEQALLSGPGGGERVLARGHAVMSEWFFQMVFLASAASIVSGTLAERVRLWPFLLFIVILTTGIYPVVGAWTWGGGWLSELGFQDFAGSTIVHSTGGWAALAGAWVVGARRGKFRTRGAVKPTPPNNVPSVTLGVLIIWFGFLGFNGGSHLASGGVADLVAISNVIANSCLASAAGVAVAVVLSRPVFGRVDVLASLNGLLGGLVAITAGPDITDHNWVLFIGAIGGAVSTIGMRFLQRVRIDDEVGAIPVHMGAGVWGTLAVCIAGGATGRDCLDRTVRVRDFASGVEVDRPGDGGTDLSENRDHGPGFR